MSRIDYSKLELFASTEPGKPQKSEASHPTTSFPERAPISPLLLSTTEASAALGISRTQLYRLISDGYLRTVQIYGRRLVSKTALRDLICELESAA